MSQQTNNRSSSLPGHKTLPLRQVQLIPSPDDSFHATRNKLQIDNDYKYLPPIKPIHQEKSDPKWKEYKIDGKHIHNRAYASIAYHDNYLYLYGGYQVSLGIMSDFYRMNLSTAQFQWEKITPSTKETPGGRTRSSFCTHPTSNRLFLFGGQIQPSRSTNLMYCWDIDQQKWIKRKVNQTYPPEIDNHSSCLYERQNETYLVVVGGFFGGTIGLHSNCVFMYNFDTNDWIKLYPQSMAEVGSSVHAPAPRDGAGLARYQEKVFFFGGSNGHERFNDLWSFHLEKKEWSFIYVRNQVIPRVRSGHSLNIIDTKLILFGGIHDITWELDDMQMFDLETQEWIIVDEDSRKDNQLQVPSKDTSPTKTNNRKSVYILINYFLQKHRTSSLKKKSPSRARQSSTKDNNSPSRNDESQSDLFFAQSQGKIALTLAQAHQKTLEEKKKKELTVKKMNMLKLFDVPDIDKSKFDISSPTSEAMKNSLMVIGNPKSDLKIRPGKLTEFGKITFSRFLLPLSAMKNNIPGKRPCARDGHSTVLIQNTLIIFGGDRHQMSFNDIHAVDLILLKSDHIMKSQQK